MSEDASYEGATAVEEALNLILRQQSLSKLDWNDGLFLAA